MSFKALGRLLQILQLVLDISSAFAELNVGEII